MSNNNENLQYCYLATKKISEALKLSYEFSVFDKNCKGGKIN